MLSHRVLLTPACKKMLYNNSRKKVILFLLPPRGVAWMVTPGAEFRGVTLYNV